MHCSKVNVDIGRTSNGSPGSGRHSQFRKNLMEILRRPYNEMEYKKLMHEVSYRRPKKRDRELRSGTKSYSMKSCSKSYLDQYSGKFILTYAMFSYILNVIFMIDEAHVKNNSKFTTIVRTCDFLHCMN